MADGSLLPAGVGRRDAGLLLPLRLALAVLVVPAQFASLIAFDSTGLDTVVPDLLFMSLVPAAVVALVPAAVAFRFYPRRRALAVAGGVFLLYALLAVSLVQFYVLCCGPGPR